MLTPEGSALVRDTEDWLRELSTLKRSALSRRDVVQAEELQAELDELTALLDTTYNTAGYDLQHCADEITRAS